MRQEFYTLPLKLNLVMLQKEHPKCTVQQSVAQQLHLILTTAFGEVPFNEKFGSGIWDHDFDNLTSGTKLKELIRTSLLESIRQHEKRLGNVRVDLLIIQEELLGDTIGRHLKKRMDITVTGVLNLTNEHLTYKDSFFIGPLSY